MVRCRLVGYVFSAFAMLHMSGAAAATFTVNSADDVPDANPGNGACETSTGNHICTLRAAIEESNALAGIDEIVLQPNVTYLLTRVGAGETASATGDLNILDSVAIDGGPNTIIDGNGSVTGDRVLEIAACQGGSSAPCSASHAPILAAISGVTIQHGMAFGGGGISNNGTLGLTDCVVADNTSTGDGGGIFSFGDLHLTRTVVSGNKAVGGGGIYAAGVTIAFNATIIANKATGLGGGIFQDNVGLQFVNSTASGNSTTMQGGGIAATTAHVISRNSTISGNSSGQEGGGVFASGGDFDAENSTLSGNSGSKGGGIFSSQNATGLFNATITSNFANSTSGGGGVSQSGSAPFTLINTIIAQNRKIVSSTVQLDDCAGTLTSQGHSIVETINTGACSIMGAVTSINPLLGPLQDNGGSTKTHALPNDSPAIDKGDVNGCTDLNGNVLATDQRGVARPSGPRCDIGAYEANDLLFQNGFEPAPINVP
jgi:CSLREA domain-containing protein